MDTKQASLQLQLQKTYWDLYRIFRASVKNLPSLKGNPVQIAAPVSLPL